MAPSPSRPPDVSRLVEDLVSGNQIQRESAAARLAVIGARTVPRLIDVVRNARASSDARAAALRALSAIGDVRAVAVATDVLDARDPNLSLDAIDVLGGLVQGTEAEATTAFDKLAELALDAKADVEHRLAAIDALDGLPERLLRPLYQTLASDPASRVVARIVRKQAGVMLSLTELVERGLPDNPALVGAAVREDGAEAKLTTLKRAVEAVRARESTSNEEAALLWRAVRGQLHQALADRGSRMAVDDVRETLESTRGPLPVGFVSAAGAVGDDSCLEAIATAWVEAKPEDRWWRDHLADAFGAIVSREGVTRRHRTLQKIMKRWPSAGVLVATARP